VRALYIPTFTSVFADTQFSIVQALATLATGLIIGLVFIWKLGLVGLGTFPLLSIWGVRWS